MRDVTVTTPSLAAYRRRLEQVVQLISSHVQLDSELLGDINRGLTDDLKSYENVLPALYGRCLSLINGQYAIVDIASSINTLFMLLDVVATATEVSRFEIGTMKGALMRYLEIHSDVAQKLPRLMYDVRILLNKPL